MIPRERWVHLRALAAVGCVVAIGWLIGPSAQAMEVVWAGLGAGGLVYALPVAERRWALDRWRRKRGLNGELRVSTLGHAWLRSLGVLAQLLILISGLVAMMTPEPVRRELQFQDAVITACLIGLGLSATISSWIAEGVAEEQARYALLQRAQARKDDGWTPQA